MSEAKFESIMRELREAAPPAPEKLRDTVRALPVARPRLALRLRPALSAAIVIAVAVGLGAALVGGLKESGPRTNVAYDAGSRAKQGAAAGKAWNGTTTRSLELAPRPTNGRAFGPQLLTDQAQRSALAPGRRLQRYGVAMSLRVRDLSGATQSAVRQTRRLGGYIAAADYSTGAKTGDSTLDLRVPVQNVQQAIAKFTDLGTILSQRISVGDLQAPLDQTDARIAAQQKIVDELSSKSFRTPDEQARLDAARSALRRLNRTHANLIREGTYAKISLQLTTRKAAAKHVAPGRFDRFWGDAGDILGKEAIAVLYALVVAGPFAILALIALLGERARRRRSDHRLLEETG
jgi:hypothetical protein